MVPAKPDARPAVPDDHGGLRTALPGLRLRQLDRLPQPHGRPGADPRDPQPDDDVPQRHVPAGEGTLQEAVPEGHQHLRPHAGQAPARQAAADVQHRRGQRGAPDLHLGRIADVGPGPAAVVLGPQPRPYPGPSGAVAPEEGGEGAGGAVAGAVPAGRRRSPARPARPAAGRPGRGGAAAADRNRRRISNARNCASPASTSAAAPPT